MPNEINLFGEIGGKDGVTAQQVKTLLAKMDQTQELTVRIDSPGGSVFDGLSIHDAFANYPGPKKAVIESTAMSIASYIAMAFDEVEISENGYMMIHEPSGSVDGTASDLMKDAALLTKLDQSMVTSYARKTGMDEESVRGLMKAETYLNASEALAAGFVNSVNALSIPSRIQPTAQHTKMPQRVYAALFGGTTGDNHEPTKDKTMSTTQPVAASIKEIKAAFPKMKDSFFVKCLERELPIASVASAAAEELTAENTELLARVAELEEELAAARSTSAKAMDDEETTAEGEEEEPEAEDDEEVTAKVTARRKATPVARKRSAAPTTTATQRWNEAIDAAMITAKSKFKAAAIVNKKYPGLRDQMVAEAN